MALADDDHDPFAHPFVTSLPEDFGSSCDAYTDFLARIEPTQAITDTDILYLIDRHSLLKKALTEEKLPLLKQLYTWGLLSKALYGFIESELNKKPARQPKRPAERSLGETPLYHALLSNQSEALILELIKATEVRDYPAELDFFGPACFAIAMRRGSFPIFEALSKTYLKPAKASFQGISKDAPEGPYPLIFEAVTADDDPRYIEKFEYDHGYIEEPGQDPEKRHAGVPNILHLAIFKNKPDIFKKFLEIRETPYYICILLLTAACNPLSTIAMTPVQAIRALIKRDPSQQAKWQPILDIITGLKSAFPDYEYDDNTDPESAVDAINTRSVPSHAQADAQSTQHNHWYSLPLAYALKVIMLVPRFFAFIADHFSGAESASQWVAETRAQQYVTAILTPAERSEAASNQETVPQKAPGVATKPPATETVIAQPSVTAVQTHRNPEGRIAPPR